MGLSSGTNKRGISEINVTPLVDVMLVLMIIFMITAPMIQHGIQVDLPTSAASAMPDDDDKMVITITKDKRFFLNDIEFPFQALSTKLKHNIKVQADKEVYLHADRALTYGYIVDLMAALKNLGIENIGMVTDPLGPQQQS